MLVEHYWIKSDSVSCINITLLDIDILLYENFTLKTEFQRGPFFGEGLQASHTGLLQDMGLTRQHYPARMRNTQDEFLRAINQRQKIP